MGVREKAKRGGGPVGLRAVVDIGSNSVRLVIYDGPKRTPIPIFNEKALCGLGRNFGSGGDLDKEAVGSALATLQRFKKLLDEIGVSSINVVATAAVREAADGGDFLSAVEMLGFDVRLATGTEEAMLAALGVVSFEPGATGIAGDMGGGSLELVELQNGNVKDSVSLPIGPLSLMRAVGDDIVAARKLISKEISKVGFITKATSDTLYTVGGAWRAIARIHMSLRQYPLSVLHHYEIKRTEVIEICDLISHQSRRSLEDLPGIPRRRIDTLPYASVVLEKVLDQMSADRIVVSAGGVREGILFNELSNKERKLDPLFEACRFYAERLSPLPLYGDSVVSVIEPLFSETEKGGYRRRHAAAILCDIGAYFHPDLRAQQAFDTALGAPFASISHTDRVWIALALFHRHRGRVVPALAARVIGLLSLEDQQSALRFGLALRFVSSFSPKTIAPLKETTLQVEGGKLLFRAPLEYEGLMGETPRKRAIALASAFEVEFTQAFEDA